MTLTYWSSPGLTEKVRQIIREIPFEHINPGRVVCVKSTGSKSRAYARIYAFPKVWQTALGIKPYYVIEVLSERFDKLKTEQKERILVHELMHIPKTFSGALVPHTCFGKRIDRQSVERMYRRYKRKLEYKTPSRLPGMF